MYACRAAGMAEPLQRFNWSMRDVLYEVLDSVHMLSDQLKGKALQSYNWDTILYVYAYRVWNGLTVAEMQWVNGGCTMRPYWI